MAKKPASFEYNGTLVKVLDGDTIDCYIDLGFDLKIKKRIRYMGIDTWESRTKDLEEKAKKSGMLAHTLWILGYPGETYEEMQQTIDFSIELDLDTAFFYVVRAFPGTELFSDIINNGTNLLTYDDLLDYQHVWPTITDNDLTYEQVRIKKILEEEDIFDLNKIYNSYFDVVYEYTCYCAIPLERRKDYRKMVYDILCDKGIYIGILFPVGKKKSDGGPPFGVDIEDTKGKFMKYFKLLSCEDNLVSVERRVGQEKVIVLEK